MSSKSQRPKRRDAALSALDLFIQALSVAKDTCGVPPAQIALGAACILLSTIKNTMDNKDDYIDLGLTCADVCEALERGLGGKGSGDLSEPVRKAIDKLTTTVTDIQTRVDEKNKRNAFARAFHAQSDKDAIAAWKQDLNRILHIFTAELVINTHVAVARIEHYVLAHEGSLSGHHSSQDRIPVGELPPAAPKTFFGRNGLIEDIVHHAVNLKSIALIGAGGIGKTSIALTALHDPRIKDSFGDNRRFIRCDKFTPSRANFLAQLSRAIGAGIENPEDLTSLRPFLSSKKMILFFDNAESALDPQGSDAQEIYAIFNELSDFSNICLGVTSRISTIPPHLKRLEIPTLAMEAACDIFYSIYDNGGRSNIINNLVRQLDFHALSITLLATTASHNLWSYNRLAEEWGTRRGQVLQTDHDPGLAPTIELSLTSPTFRKLDSSARKLLGVIAFFSQGLNERNLEWWFPMIPDIKSTVNTFCALSLTHRNNDFITMLAPIRDYIAPRDPRSSPLLCMIRDRYFARLSVDLGPTEPGFEEARWIILEDANVEHLLNIFTSIDPNADNVWDACGHFMEHLYWHKPRKTVLGPKIEDLPDTHRSKPRCLFELSQLFERAGNHTERKRLLTHALALERGRGNNPRVAKTLRCLADANRTLRLFGKGIQQVKEALGIFEQLGDTAGQVDSLNILALSLYYDNQFDAAENAAVRAIGLVPEEDHEYLLCQSHRYLGHIYQDKGQKRKAIHHFEIALNIASPLKLHLQLFWIHYGLANLFLRESEFGDANSHITQAKSHAIEDTYKLGRAMELQAGIWERQGKLKDAKFEVAGALEIFENNGAAQDAERCRNTFRRLNQW